MKTKLQRNDRMNISYMPPELHKKIRIYCIKEGITLATWAKNAHESLTK